MMPSHFRSRVKSVYTYTYALACASKRSLLTTSSCYTNNISRFFPFLMGKQRVWERDYLTPRPSTLPYSSSHVLSFTAIPGLNLPLPQNAFANSIFWALYDHVVSGNTSLWPPMVMLESGLEACPLSAKDGRIPLFWRSRLLWGSSYKWGWHNCRTRQSTGQLTSLNFPLLRSAFSRDQFLQVLWMLHVGEIPSTTRRSKIQPCLDMFIPLFQRYMCIHYSQLRGLGWWVNDCLSRMSGFPAVCSRQAPAMGHKDIRALQEQNRIYV